MATIEDVLKLLNMQSEAAETEKREREIERRKEKEDRDSERKEVKETMNKFVEEVVNVKTELKDIKSSQSKTEQNYDLLATRMNMLETQMKELHQKDAAKPQIQVRGSIPPFSQPCSPSQQPSGRMPPSDQPYEGQAEQKKIYSIVKEARRTIGFSPISEDDIKIVMEDNKIDNREAALEATIKDFMYHEMAIPKEMSDKLETAKIFRPPGDVDSEKHFVEFTEDTMPGIIYKYVKKLNHTSSVHTFIPPPFKARADDLEKCAYELRHGTPAYNTRIKWGSCDLMLERKLKSNTTERYHSVSVKDLPPVNLNPPPPAPKLPNPSSSPAPGRKNRSKRIRSTTPTH